MTISVGSKILSGISSKLRYVVPINTNPSIAEIRTVAPLSPNIPHPTPNKSAQIWRIQ